MVNRITICKEDTCNDMQIIQGYCRLHYLKNWRKIKEAECAAKKMSFADFIKEASEKLKNRVEGQESGESDKTGWAERRMSDLSVDLQEISTDLEFDAELENILNGLKVAPE